MSQALITAIFSLLLTSSSLNASSPADHIYESTLENGLQIIVIENATVPLVTIQMEVRHGAFTESPEYDGLAHMFEHMFFKANAEIPNQERFLERTRELGMTFNATTREEQVTYSFTVLKDSLNPGLAFMKAAIASPLFLPEELERERLVVIDEYDRHESNPTFHLDRAVDEKLWYKYFSRKNTIGDRDVIMTVTQEKMRKIQEKYYIPNNSALLVAGAVEHAQVFEVAETLFSDWRKGPEPFAEDPFDPAAIPEHPPLRRTETVIVEQPVNAVTIMLRWHGPSVSQDPDETYAADVFSFLMNRNSKLPRILISTGLFSNISFSYLTLDYTGPITVFGETSAERFKAGKTALFEELKYLISDDYFSDDQIEYAKTQLEVRELYNWERPSQFVQTVGGWWSVTGSLDYYRGYVENLKKVTRKDINAFVKKYIQDAPHVMGILVSPEDRKKLKLQVTPSEKQVQKN